MKIDLGSGPYLREGFVRVDDNPKCNPDVLMDMKKYVSELKDNSVDEAIASQSMEFLDGWEIYEFVNHLHRAIKPGGKFRAVVTCVTLPGGSINHRAWGIPVLKTRFSPDTFRLCFTGGPTEALREVKPWKITDVKHEAGGALVVEMTPKK